MKSWLYCPGNNPKMIINAALYGAEGLVFDLEDAVAEERKGEARFLLAQAFSEKVVPQENSAVRINGVETEPWRKDLHEIIPAGVRIIRLPKVENPRQVEQVCSEIGEIETTAGISPGSVSLQCIFETPTGVENAFVIGKASSRIRAYSLGSEDYCTALGVNRSRDLLALDYPRSRIASAAAAYGFLALDTVWGFIKDPEGLKEDTLRGKRLGFHGKSVIHPDQIEIVNKLYTPTEEEIAKARALLERNNAAGGDASSLDGRMIDAPVVKRARRVLEDAGILEKNHEK